MGFAPAADVNTAHQLVGDMSDDWQLNVSICDKHVENDNSSPTP